MMKGGLLSLGKASARWVLAKVVADLLILMTTVVVVDRVAYIIGLAVLGAMTRELLYTAVAAIILALAGRLIFSWLSSRAAFGISARVKIGVRDRIYCKLLELELGYRDVRKTGGIVATTLEGVEALGVFYGLFLPQVFLSILIPVALFAYLVRFSYSIALSLILAILLIPISVGAVQAWVKRVAKMHWSTYEDLNAYYLDSLQGFTTLKLLGQTERRTQEISKRSWDFRNATMRLLHVNLASILVMDLIAMLGTALGIALALTSLSAGLITVQVAILVLIISYEFFRPLRLLGSYFHFAMQGLSASKSILMILAQETTHDKRVEARGLEMGLNHDIEFKDVAFSYGDGSPKVLKDVSFKSETGRITAIVGLSGSGKTTIANLITKLYEPDSGKVLIGNRNLQTIDRNSIRNRISMISQRSFLFHGTIRENLLIAKPDATDDELYQACQRAGIIDFVNSLRNGLDSSLTEQARNISDGQVQRIAIARTLLRDSPILILDEPTSNVDSANEETILRTLKEITKQKTTILIAHRLSTVCDCDKIIVIEDGCVVEEGTHRELMARDGVYAELFHDQAMFDLLHRQQVTIVQ